jgi:galactokinase
VPFFDRDSVAAAFRDSYGVDPNVVVRTPGRVNLIGEHTDYAGLPVLPMAIAASTWVGAGPGEDGRIRATSTAFPGLVDLSRESPAAGAGWARYLTGALAELAHVAPGRGADIYITGDLPTEGGLSSSSALTVGILAALASAWGAPLAREDLLPLAIAAERHTGVESGGMDQEVMLFATAGHALRIDFHPPARRQVAMPAGLAFVVASSGEVAEKSAGARDAYNERVAGMRFAATMLADQVGVDLDMPPTLAQVYGVDVVDLLVDELPPKISAREVAHGRDVDVAALVQLSHTTFDQIQKVPVRGVAQHIMSEAARVDAAEQALGASDFAAFGAILDASHASLRDAMRCSTPALDRLCKAMRRAGAFGARLTGAGFGGYAVAACPPEAVGGVIQAAIDATGGPAFEVSACAGLEIL